MERGYPGIVYTKEYANSPEITHHLFKARVEDSKLPVEILPPGLDAARQWYLYDQIRQFCGSRLAEDLTCPKPTVPKPGGHEHDRSTTPEQLFLTGTTSRKRLSNDESSSSASKRPRVCSYCKKPGHNKCRGTKILCPKLIGEQNED